MQTQPLPDDLEHEAESFNQRITERRQHGFIPDLRRAVKCEYFYKSFFRDPYFMDIYLGEASRRFVRQLKATVKDGAKVLDAGCGSGFFALEMARSGYHVLGMDIADKAIEAAKETAADNPFKDGFGSLEYRVGPIQDVQGKFDAVLFSGVLHHMEDPGAVLDHVTTVLEEDGVILGHEPSHELWGFDDAAQVALIRGLLSLTGHWYESPKELPGLSGPEDFVEWIGEIHTEYRLERDKSEPGGQSPHDLSSTGIQIMQEIRKRFHIIEQGPHSSFLYRLLGGIRGDDSTGHRLADFVTAYERAGLKYGFLKPQAIYFLARRK